MTTVASKTVTAENSFTDAVQLIGWFNLSISGTFSATVTVQRSINNSSWVDADSFTTAIEQVGMDPELVWYRVGVKTGNFTSGSVVIRLGQEGEFRS